MTRRKKPSAPCRPYARTTVPLQGTVSSTEAKLDFSSTLTIAYVQEALFRRIGKRVPSSGVIRAALQSYIDHLEDSGRDDHHEERRVTRCCASRDVSPEHQEAAWKRLADAPADQPLAAFKDILLGPEARAQIAALNDQVDSIVERIGKTHWGRFHRINDNPAEQDV